MSIYSGETVELPTEQEAADRWHQDHPKCEWCEEAVAVVGKDGLELNCHGCDLDQGRAVSDEHGIVAYVHDACREEYTLDCLVEEVNDALQVGLPLGLKPWAIDRARNVVTRLMLEYNIAHKENGK